MCSDFTELMIKLLKLSFYKYRALSWIQRYQKQENRDWKGWKQKSIKQYKNVM